MKIVIAHTVVDASKELVDLIANSCGVGTNPVPAHRLNETRTGRVQMVHEGSDIVLTVDDAMLIRFMALYLKIARFAVPIVQSCLTFADTLKQEIKELGDWMESDAP